MIAENEGIGNGDWGIGKEVLAEAQRRRGKRGGTYKYSPYFIYGEKTYFALLVRQKKFKFLGDFFGVKTVSKIHEKWYTGIRRQNDGSDTNNQSPHF